VVNPETRNIIQSQTITPSPSSYRLPSDNLYYSKVKLAEKKEIRFFSPKMMPEMKARIPVQYTSLDGIHMRAITDLKNLNSNLPV
jgi:hypothetical protein